MKSKKIILPLGIVILTTLLIVTYFFIFSNKELKIMKIDGEDSSYIIENVEQNDEFKINTDSINYSITDIQGKKIKTDNKLDNHVLTMKAKAQYQDNIIYKIELNKGDSFVDEKLKDAKKIYFAINNKEFSKNDLKYEVLSTNLKNQYTLKDKKLKLDKLIIKLKIKTLNKEVTIKPSKYKLFIDNKEQSLNLIKSSKGKHTIKIQFNYDGKRYDYSKKVNFKEVSMDQLAKSIYKKSLGEGVIIVDINQDGIPEAISTNDNYSEDELTGRTTVNVYSIDSDNDKAYLVCSKVIESMEDMKLIEDSRVLLVGHIASDTKTLYLMRFGMDNDKLQLTKYSKGSLMEHHDLDFDDPKYYEYYIEDKEYYRKEFLKTYPVIKDLDPW